MLRPPFDQRCTTRKRVVVSHECKMSFDRVLTGGRDTPYIFAAALLPHAPPPPIKLRFEFTKGRSILRLRHVPGQTQNPFRTDINALLHPGR